MDSENYSYTKVEVNGMEIYIRRICQKENTNEFIQMFKKYYDFELKTIVDED